MIYNIFKKIDNGLEKFSSVGLVVALGGMLIFSGSTIVLRWFNITFLWMDPLVRHLVFFSAFLGGSLATSKGNHIRIDLAAKILENSKNELLHRFLGILINAVCFGALVWLAKASVDFTKMELQYGKEAFLGIHSGFLVSTIPIGFGIIAYRFFFQTLRYLFNKVDAEESLISQSNDSTESMGGEA